ncbi:MAG: hypothetical protein AAB519_00840, partial [Patescibacteria group bacterium]
MPLYVKNKNRKTAYNSLIFALAIGMVIGWWQVPRSSFAQSETDSIRQIPLSASLFDSESKIITNGEYQVRFGIYRIDRTEADPYPSNADAGNRVWEETQAITVKNGIFRASLGSVTPFPESLNFENGNYYIGIRMGTDSEMVPRKKLGSVPRAINSQFLQGRTIGTKSGNIPVLGSGGKINIKNLPTGNGNSELVLGNDSRFDNIDQIHEQNTDTGTTETIFNVGSETALAGNNFDLTVSSSATPPALRYNGTTQAWQFSNDGTTFTDVSGGGGGLSGTGTNGYAAYWTGTGTLAAEAQLSVSRGGTGAASLNDLITLGTHTTGNYVASVANGNGITGGAAGSEGGALTLAVDLLDSADGTGSISSNSGLEFAGTGSNELGLLQGCANGQGISWNDGTNVWECASFSAGLSGTGTNGYVTYWSGVSSLGSEAQLNVVRGGTGVDGSAASNGTLLIGNGSGYTLATITDGSGITVTEGAGTITIASTLGTSIDLASEVTGTLPVGNGGTGATTFTANGVLYGNTTGAVQVTAAGTNGQLFLGVTAGAPVFATMSSDATITNAGVLTIAADAVALTTDTTGNYVATITAGNGISGTSSSEGGTPTIALGALTANWDQTGAFDISLNNASSELQILESAGATFYGIFDVTDLSANRTYTFPDTSGTVLLSG